MTLPAAPPPPGPPGPAAREVEGWHRLHPLSPLVRGGRHLVGIGVLIVLLLFANRRQAGSDLITDLVIVAVVLVAGVINWLVTRWQVTGGVLLIDTGLLRRKSERIPLSQVQAIDVVQTGLARVLGLAELRLRMAGADTSGGRLACLRRAEAEELRRTLLSLSKAPGPAAVAGSAGPAAPASPAGALSGTAPGRRPGPSAAEGTERLLFRVNSGRLAVAVVLSKTGAAAAIAIAGLATAAAVSGHPGVFASVLPVGLGVVLAVWRLYNGEFGTVVAEAADGLRLRSGLVQTTAETIRTGRVQAVRIVEPLVWRAFGWCRLEVDVAGGRERRENRSESRRLRALVPVGTRADAERMLRELVSDPPSPSPSQRPPARARWKAPLAYHFLGWSGNDRYIVASGGRVAKKTTWVPLEKVQSIRWVQGPLQRRLALASVRLDVAGRRVTANIKDRDAAEADDILRRLPDLARAARTRPAARPPGPPGPPGPPRPPGPARPARPADTRLQVRPLPALALLVGVPGRARAVQGGGLRDRHVPPAFR
ncbi:MAG TPA: PH domain-containing protein [Streptosporangiaceae bacterium]